MKLITSAAAIALGLSFVTPSTAQTRDEIETVVGTCNEHGWIKTYGDDGYLAIGVSGDFIFKRVAADIAIKGRWTEVRRYVGVVSIPFPSSADPTFISAECPDNQLRFEVGWE